ncbi:glucan endo-1,3-beta-D-glucosidase [Caldicellulosiruptor acetigenus I77R1B]|uniref:Glucan endo-1,3-beta-D-glucosidase n=2 Tax=Caldicellulosiruptor acetigenus TaxID=301953 RepID=E4S8G0_CALA7|nr:glucan endo-1,3-beta-D-glucosidase [Caldicellulosiruptor acetigenus I77R1B]
MTKGSYWVYSYSIKEKVGMGSLVERRGKIKMQVVYIYEASDYKVYDSVKSLQGNFYIKMLK